MERKHIGEQNTEMCNGAGIAKEGFLDRKFRERNLIGKEGKRGPSPASKYSETAGNAPVLGSSKSSWGQEKEWGMGTFQQFIAFL